MTLLWGLNWFFYIYKIFMLYVHAKTPPFVSFFQVLANILGTPKRGDWKACKLEVSEERALARWPVQKTISKVWSNNLTLVLVKWHFHPSENFIHWDFDEHGRQWICIGGNPITYQSYHQILYKCREVSGFCQEALPGQTDGFHQDLSSSTTQIPESKWHISEQATDNLLKLHGNLLNGKKS